MVLLLRIFIARDFAPNLLHPNTKILSINEQIQPRVLLEVTQCNTKAFRKNKAYKKRLLIL